MAQRRPEHAGPPELFYNTDEASQYAGNSRIRTIQLEMTERAIELLELPEDRESLLLDIGCGTGISGECLTDAGHRWIGVDVARAMLEIARKDDDVEGDLMELDIGAGLPFRAGSFDGAISISVIQWLCHANTSEQQPKRRLNRFFISLYACLGRGARAVFQFYPEHDRQTDLIMAAAKQAGFAGGLVIDHPESAKNKKLYLVLSTGGVSTQIQAPKADEEMEDEEVAGAATSVDVAGRRKFTMPHAEKNAKRPTKGSKQWIEAKRQRAIRQGKDVQEGSKYSGRKRKVRF